MDTDISPKPLHKFGVIMAGAMAIFMVNLDATVVNIVLPELSGQFHIDTADASLVVLTYLLALTGTALMFGRLSDMKGPEQIFLGGYLMFSLGSGLCAMGWNLGSLAAFRFIQGIGGAMIFATSAVIVMRYIPEHMRGRAYAINGMMAGVGFAMGSPVGGFLAHHFGWRAVFLVNIPIGILGLLLCLKFLTRRDHTASAPSFDVRGAVTSFLALSVLVYTLNGLADSSSISLKTVAGLAVAIILGILFVRGEKRRKDPLLTLSLFNNRRLNFALAGTATYYVILQGTAIIFPFYFIHARGLTEIQAGSLLFAGPMVTIILSPFSGWLCDKVGPKIPCLAGATLFIVSIFLFLNFDAATSTAAILASLILFGVAMNLYAAPILMLTMSHAQPHTLGILSSVKAVLPSIIGMLGVGIFATFYTYSVRASDGAGPAASQTGFHNTMYLALAVGFFCLLFTFLTEKKD